MWLEYAFARIGDIDGNCCTMTALPSNEVLAERRHTAEMLSLIIPNSAFATEYQAFVAEVLAIDGLNIRQPEGDFDTFVRQLAREARGEDLPEGMVPQSTFWLICDNVRLVGISRLRHMLTPTFEAWGGHIGYQIRPSEWRKGYGTQLLALTLEHARAIHLPRVLLMCREENVGSKRIIEKNGGILAGTAVSPRNGKLYLRYWIELERKLL